MSAVRKKFDDVRRHYDRLSPLYQFFWGDHIHHGFWRNGESPRVAQINLIEELFGWAQLRVGSRVLDIGCGTGGTSCWLAKNKECRVTGITISPVQAKMAQRRAKREGVEGRVDFRTADAETGEGWPDRADAIWIVECSEHLHDRARFFQRCADTLAPDGTLALCAWVDTSQTTEQRNLVAEISDRMVCPPLARISDYEQWLSRSGLANVRGRDITPNVERTWDLCSAIASRWTVRLLTTMMGRPTRRFVASFPMMGEAFRTGAMGYWMAAASR